MKFELKPVQEKKKFIRRLDTLLITGDGKGFPQDLESFLGFKIEHEVMTIGRSISKYPGQVQHYVDVDADAGKWIADNLMDLYPGQVKGGIIKHTLGAVAWFDNCWDMDELPFPDADVMWHGSSALFGVLVALELGYTRIVLAGCPMDSKGHWYFPTINEGPIWTAESYQAWFEFTLDPRKRLVRSMSGYTEILLGAPDKEFFNGLS